MSFRCANSLGLGLLDLGVVDFVHVYVLVLLYNIPIRSQRMRN